MKYFLIGLIKAYQMTPLSTHSMCKYTPTCSNYAIESIIEYTKKLPNENVHSVNPIYLKLPEAMEKK